MKKDNIVQFKKAIEEKETGFSVDLFEDILNAVDSVVDDNTPLIDVLEHLAVITAIVANHVGIPAATLMTCFAKTVEQIYEED